MVRKTVIALMLFLTTAANVKAQSDDFGIWTSVEAQKKVNKKLNFDIEGEMRTRDNTSEMSRWSIGAGVTYKLTKWLKASAGYVFLYDNNVRISYYDETDKKVIQGLVNVGDPKKRGEYWGERHRVNVSLTGSYSIGHIDLSLRERWQYTYRPEKTVDSRYNYYEEEWEDEPHTYDGKGKNVLRSRLQAEYSKKGMPFNPYASVEFFNAWSLDKTRFIIGTDYKITKQHIVGLDFKYQALGHDDDEDSNDLYILGISYKFKF